MVKGADPRAAGLHVRSIRRVKNPNAAAPGAFYRSTAIGQAPVKPQSAPASADAKWAADGTALKTMPHLTFVAAVDALTTVPEVLISGEATTRGAASYAFARALTGAADAAGNKDGLTTRQELASFVRHYVRTLSLERQSPMIQPLTAATHAAGLFQITASPAPDVASSVAPLPPASAPQSLAPSSHPTPAVPAGITKPNPSQTAATASALMATQLLHDTRTGDVITPSGDVLAFNITAADLTPVVERVSAFGRLAQLSASRPQDLIMSPATPVFAGGERFVVTIPDILGHYIIIANLTGTGELQYMFPLGNADPLIDSPSLELPFTAGKPYGADTLIIIASRERATMLELELSQLGGKKKPLAVTDAIERLLPTASRLGIVTYQTRPPS